MKISAHGNHVGCRSSRVLKDRLVFEHQSLDLMIDKMLVFAAGIPLSSVEVDCNLVDYLENLYFSLPHFLQIVSPYQLLYNMKNAK